MATPTLTAPLTYERGTLTDETLLRLHLHLLRPRMIEEKMLKMLRRGEISKWFSGIGQEAISVGATLALRENEWIFPMHRNLGVFTSRGLPLDRLFAQWQGKPLGYTNGRDRSFHFGAPEHHVVGMISHLGPQLSLAAGVGLAHRLGNDKAISLAFTGEGGTSQGEFHEALNTAAVWSLPTIFIIENNGYGLSTPTAEQYACQDLADRGSGYGMRALTIDGNNILEVYRTICELAAEMRENPFPVLLECQTFRMRGHEEASGTKYVPQDLMDQWAERDPLDNYEQWLRAEGLLTDPYLKQLRATIKTEIERGLDTAGAAPVTTRTIEEEAADLFAPAPPPLAAPASSSDQEEVRFIDAISDGLREAMLADDKLVLMGQDIADYGGVFKITDGFTEQFGKDRVRNTPLCESAILGIGLGLSIAGYRAMVEMQFGDFVTCGFNQIVNNLAKLHYRWGQNAAVTVRLPCGGGVGAGPFHSQTNEAWFFHVPGLKVVYPATPEDAKGLLLAALADPNPVLYFEHKALYRSLSGVVPKGNYRTEIGKARVDRAGSALSVITYGMGVHWARAAVAATGIDAEILDLRSLAPLDWEAVTATARKTGRVLVLHEDNLTGGVGGEIAAYLSEHCFEALDAPVRRLASADTPIPFIPQLEANYLPSPERLAAALEALAAY